MTNNFNSTVREGKTVTHRRLLDAPIELVWDVWTKPEHVKEWYGPDGFTVTNNSMKVEAGGTWIFTMHGPDKDYPNVIHYHEVKKPTLLKYRHGSDKQDAYSFEVTVTFEEMDGKTLVTMHSVFSSKELLDELIVAVNALEGGKQTLNRMIKHVESQLEKSR